MPDSGANRRPESRGVAQKPVQATNGPLAVGKGSSVLEHGPCRHPLGTLLTAEMVLEEEDLPTPVAEGARTSHFPTSIRAG